jgi:hypothetical protein
MMKAGDRVRIRTMRATTGKVRNVATFRTRTPYWVDFSSGEGRAFAESDLIPMEMACGTCGGMVPLSIDAVGLCGKCQKRVTWEGKQG